MKKTKVKRKGRRDLIDHSPLEPDERRILEHMAQIRDAREKAQQNKS